MSDDRWSVAQWMSRDVRSCPSNAPLVEAAELMRIHRIRHVPIVDRGRLVGIVTDRDVRGVLPRPDDLHEDPAPYSMKLLGTRIEDVMTRLPLTTSPCATIREVALVIVREKVGALPVVDDGALVGIISSEDLLRAFADELRELEAREVDSAED